MKFFAINVIVIIFFILFLLFPYGYSTEESFSSVGQAKDNTLTHIYQPGASEDDDDEDDDDDDEEEDEGKERASESSEEVLKRVKKERERFGRSNFLKVGNVIKSKRDGRYYAKSSTKLFVSCEEVEDDDDVNTGVAGINLQIDGGPFYSYDGDKTNDFFIKDEGEHVITVRASDKVGNQSRRQTHRVVIDNTAPFMFVNYIIDPNYPEKQSANVDNTIVTPLIQGHIVHIPRCHRIFCTAVDMGAGMPSKEPDYGIEVSIDSNKWQFFNTDPEDGGIKFPLPGLHTLRFRARDILGNVSEPKVIDVYVDDVTPTFFITPKYGKIIFFSPLEVDDECSDPIPPIPDPPAAPQKPPKMPKGPIDPPEFVIEDNVYDTGFEFHLKKNMFIPGSSVLGKDFKLLEAEDVPSKDVEEKGESKEEDDEDDEEEDDDDDEEEKEDKTSEDKSEGKQEVRYSGTVVVNNEKFKVGSLYDDVEDTKIFNYLPGVKNEFSISAVDPSGVPEILVRVDRGKWSIYKNPVNLYSNGVHVIDIKVADGVGNVSYARQKIFIDNLPPSAVFNNEAGEPRVRGAIKSEEDNTTSAGDDDDDEDDEGDLQRESE